MSTRRFVISAGRTGTVFLTRTLPDHFHQLEAIHEPLGSRSTLVAANARNLLGIGTSALRWKFRRELASRPDGVLEVNPMLCPLTDLVAELRPQVVVHMVRHPRSWVQSICTFKASTRFRGVIDYLPLATPYPSPRPTGWAGMRRVERALHRWTYCNQQILELKPSASRFETFRYEDLFEGSMETRKGTLTRLLHTLELPIPTDLSPLMQARRANPSPPGSQLGIPDVPLTAICGPLMAEFGYS